MLCKLCQKNKDLVKSHIIPKSFYKRLSDKNDLKRLDSTANYPKRMPKGTYDQIVCNTCEAIFNEGDNYIHNLLQEDKLTKTISDTNGTAHIIENYDLKTINSFIGSLLWRASATERDEFGAVSLGVYQNKLRSYLLNQSEFPNEIKYMFVKFNDCNSIIFSPHRKRLEKLNVYQFFLGGFGVYVKVDKKIFNNILDEFFDNDKEIWMLGLQLKDTPQYKVARKIAIKIKKSGKMMEK